MAIERDVLKLAEICSFLEVCSSHHSDSTLISQFYDYVLSESKALKSRVIGQRNVEMSGMPGKVNQNIIRLADACNMMGNLELVRSRLSVK